MYTSFTPFFPIFTPWSGSDTPPAGLPPFDNQEHTYIYPNNPSLSWKTTHKCHGKALFQFLSHLSANKLH